MTTDTAVLDNLMPEYRVELRHFEGRKPWVLVRYAANGQARIVSDHTSRDAARAAARKRGVGGLLVRA